MAGNLSQRHNCGEWWNTTKRFTFNAFGKGAHRYRRTFSRCVRNVSIRYIGLYPPSSHSFPPPSLSDEDFSGYIVIDWEVWYPWLILASKSIWVNESLAYVKGLHPSWSTAKIEAEAVRSWNATSLSFMVETLRLCVQLRPHAKWGYYGRPGCYTGLDLKSAPAECIASVQQRNDALSELWAAGTALYPSVYIEPNRAYPFIRTSFCDLVMIYM